VSNCKEKPDGVDLIFWRNLAISFAIVLLVSFILVKLGVCAVPIAERQS
jgi:hypothetical protein